MTACAPDLRASARATAHLALLTLGLALAGCASISDGPMTQGFADPAKYELYDCKQLETARKDLAARQNDLQGLMAKAETGTGGTVVAEMVYRNDLISVRGQAHFADEAWRKSKCHESPPGAASSPGTPPARPALPSRAGAAY